MLSKNRIQETLIISMILFTTSFLTGCTNRLETGWTQFSQGNYDAAKIEWSQSKDAELTEQIAKAEAASDLVKLDTKIKTAREAADHYSVIRESEEAISLDKWSDKDWLEKSPELQRILDDAKEANTSAHASIEEEYYTKLNEYQNQRDWEAIISDYSDYEAYTEKFKQEISQRIDDLNNLAVEELRKIEEEEARIAAERARQLKLQGEVDQHVEIGKRDFLNEEYQSTLIAVGHGYEVISQNPDVELDETNLEYLKLSAEQAIKIQKEIEAERRRVVERERLRIEAENRRIAEEERLAELERQQQEEERIRIAAAAEKARLQKLEAERRAEAERKRKIEEENRRWRAFLAKGSPLKPLVTTIYKESSGIGELKRGKTQKWQGGSQLPEPKDKSIASEDVYALEIVVPKTHKLTFLRNYAEDSAKNLLSPSVIQGDLRSYYTEDFKGGRYYFEVRNDRSNEMKYEVKARIYKIPVTY